MNGADDQGTTRVNELPRLKPKPVPAIHPVSEYLADDELRARYKDMKKVLQVPWMGVVTMAYAHYREFYDVLWKGIRPLCKSAEFVEASTTLREFVESEVESLDCDSLGDWLEALGYAPRELVQIRGINEIFSHGNFLYLLIATIARTLMEGGELSATKEAKPHRVIHAPRVPVRLVLLEPHHADAPTQEIFANVKSTLGLPFVNTDYRAFARWPSYFRAAWAGLAGSWDTPAHQAVVADTHRQACALVGQLPNPGGLRSEALRAAAGINADEVLSVCRLFQWLLPGLVTNVAYLRRQIANR